MKEDSGLRGVAHVTPLSTEWAAVLVCLCFGCSVVSKSSVTPCTVARQAPPSVGFFKQEHWGELPYPSPRDLPGPGIEPTAPAMSPALQVDSLPLNHWRSPISLPGPS